MKFVFFAGILLIGVMFELSNAAPQLLQGSETAGTQHGLSLGGVNLLSVGGGYTKGGAIGAAPGKGTGAGAAAGAAAGFNFGIGPLQYTNRNAASAQASLIK